MPGDFPESQIIGTPFGKVFPAAPEPAMPDLDARTHALRALRRYIAAITFQRAGQPRGRPEPFRILEKHIFIEQPDNVEDLVLPSIGIAPGSGDYDYLGLGPVSPVEGTLDAFGPGTALAYLYDYVEPLSVDVWAAKPAERRAILAAIEIAMVGADHASALYLVIPEYFDSPCSFSLDRRQNFEDDAVRGRRRATLSIEMRVPVLVPYAYSRVVPIVEMAGVDVGEDVDLTFEVG